MLYKTIALTGALLDAAVAKVLYGDKADATLDLLSSGLAADGFLPSSNWAHGGPIIERERIAIWHGSDRVVPGDGWTAEIDNCGDLIFGEAPLVAAMRAFVFAKTGAEVYL